MSAPEYSKITSTTPAPEDFFAQPKGTGFTIDFQKKVVVVTGGNRGLGVGITEALAQANASVAIIYNSAKDAQDVAASLSKKWNLPIKAYQCNVSEADKVGSTFAQIEKDMGEITAVVANSGISVVKPAVDLNADDFKKVYDVNVFGVFNTAQAAARLWIPRKHAGSIVIISSMSDTIVNSPIRQAFYNSSKAAASSIGRCLAAEWAPHNIRVNNVNPGFIETAQTSGMAQELRDNQSKEVPLGRFSKPHEQAGQVVYLLSPYSSYQTGSSVYIDGGYLAW
ncbi:hypothetical protein JCM10207_006250 [Rhodosporidiobolus poonsookiae]